MVAHSVEARSSTLNGQRVRAAVQAGVRDAWIRQTTYLGGRVGRHDGLLIALSGLQDPTLDVVLVERPPHDPVAALRRAATVFPGGRSSFGVDLDIGCHPEIEAILVRSGMAPTATRPALAADPRTVTEPRLGAAVVVHRVTDDRELPEVRRLHCDAFGMAPQTAERFLSAAALAAPGFRLYVASVDGLPVASASSHHSGDAVGVFGVSTRASHRGRGLGTAVTARAVSDGAMHGASLAWLHATADGIGVYRRMGFENVAEWTVWVSD